MPKADYQLEGYRIFWYSNDHLPEHFHAEKPGHWEIKIYFLQSSNKVLYFDIIWQETRLGPTAKELWLFRTYVENHQKHLCQEWETKVCNN